MTMAPTRSASFPTHYGGVFMVGHWCEHWGLDVVRWLKSRSPDRLKVVIEGPGLDVHLDVEWMLEVSLFSPAEDA